MDYDDLTKVKLIDFGLAVHASVNQVRDFAKCGTVLYTPPEQILKNFAYAKVSKIKRQDLRGDPRISLQIAS